MHHFHLHYPDDVTWRYSAKRPRVSTSRDRHCLVILAPVCPQCHCQSVADCTFDVTIGQFASRFSWVFCQISAEIIGWISGNLMWFRWGLKWILMTVAVMWESWRQFGGVEPMGARLKYTEGCAGGQMCWNIGMRIYHTAYRQNRKASCSKQWTDKRKNYSLWHHSTHHSV